MDRTEFLRTLCGVGVCGCVASALDLTDVLAAGQGEASDRRLAFARYQVAHMVGFMAAGTAAPACAEILQKTGRACARLGQLGVKFKGAPDAYFATAKRAFGTDFSWDKEKGIVTVTVGEGECGCPLVDSRRTPVFFCNCSVGYQHESFEAIFGKPVQVSLKESKLSGSKHCVFEVRLS